MLTVCQPALKKVKTAVHQFSTKSVKRLFAVCTTTYKVSTVLHKD